MKQIIFLALILFGCSQSPSENKSIIQEEKTTLSPLDEANGFQDIKLGTDPAYLKSRVTLINEMTEPDLFYWIVSIKDSIEPGCKMGTHARVYGYKNKISTIEYTVLCPNLITIYKTKFGEPAFDGSTYKWETDKNILVIEDSEAMKRGYKVVRYNSKEITAEWEKSKKGNL